MASCLFPEFQFLKNVPIHNHSKVSEVISIQIDPNNLPIAKSLLEQEKVRYFIKGENTLNVTGFGHSAAFPMLIFVHKDQYLNVKELLKDL